jgi:hypothetical protein
VEEVVATSEDEARYRMMAAVLLLLPNPAAVKRFLEVLEYRDVVALDAAHRGVNVGWKIVVNSEPQKALLSSTPVPEEVQTFVVNAAPRAAKNRPRTSVGIDQPADEPSTNPSGHSRGRALVTTLSTLGYRLSVMSSLPSYVEECTEEDVSSHMIRGPALFRAANDDLPPLLGPSSRRRSNAIDSQDDSFTVLHTEVGAYESTSLFVTLRDVVKDALHRLSAENTVPRYVMLGVARQRELACVTSLIGVSGGFFFEDSLPPALPVTPHPEGHVAVDLDRGDSRSTNPYLTGTHFASPCSSYLRAHLLSSFDSAAAGVGAMKGPPQSAAKMLPSLVLNIPNDHQNTCDVFDASTSAEIHGASCCCRYVAAPPRQLHSVRLLKGVPTQASMRHQSSSNPLFRSRHQFLRLDAPKCSVTEFVIKCKRDNQRKREGRNGVAAVLDDLSVLLPSVTDLMSSSGSPPGRSAVHRRWNYPLAMSTALVGKQRGGFGGAADSMGREEGQQQLEEEDGPPLDADAAGEALLGCPLSMFGSPENLRFLRRQYVQLISAAVATALMTECLMLGGRYRLRSLHIGPATLNPSSARGGPSSAHAADATTQQLDAGVHGALSQVPPASYDDRAFDIPDVILMFQAIREALHQPRHVVPRMTVTQNIDYSVVQHLAAIGGRGLGPQQIPVSTTCVLEWPITEGDCSPQEQTDGDYLRVARSGTSSPRADNNSTSTTETMILSGAGPLPLLLESVTALYRLVVTLTEHRVRDVSKSKSTYASREVRHSRHAILGTAREFLDTINATPHTSSSRTGGIVSKQHYRLMCAVDPLTSSIPTPTIIARDVTKKLGFLDFLLFSWFGATPQEKYFWIKKNDVDLHAVTTGSTSHQLADGVGPVVTQQTIDERARLEMYRGQLMYDVLGNRLLVAAVHARTPAEAQRAVLDSAVVLNTPPGDAVRRQQHHREQLMRASQRPMGTFDRSVKNTSRIEEGLRKVDPTNLTAAAAMAHLTEPTQKYSEEVSGGLLFSPIFFYVKSLASAGYRSQFFATSNTSSVVFAVFAHQTRTTGNVDRATEAIKNELASYYGKASTAGTVEEALRNVCVACCEIFPFSKAIETAEISSVDSQLTNDWTKVIEDACCLAVTVAFPPRYINNSNVGGDRRFATTSKKAQQIIFDARNCAPCLPRDDFPMLVDAAFYTPTNLLAEALQGLCPKYEAAYETCMITDTKLHHSALSHRSTVGFRCVLSITSVGGLSLPSVGVAAVPQQPHHRAFVIGVGEGHSKTEAWRHAARSALAVHFPQLLEQKDALSDLAPDVFQMISPEVRAEMGAPQFVFGSRRQLSDTAAQIGASSATNIFGSQGIESVCRVFSSPLSALPKGPREDHSGLLFECVGSTDAAAFVSAVKEVRRRVKCAISAQQQQRELENAVSSSNEVPVSVPLFRNWDVTSNYTKSFLHVHLGALGVALKAKLRVSLRDPSWNDHETMLHPESVSNAFFVSIETMDDRNHLRVSMLHPNPETTTGDANVDLTVVIDDRRHGSLDEKGAVVRPGGAMLVELFTILRREMYTRCDSMVREREFALLRHSIQRRMQVEGTSFRLSVERRVQYILRALLGLQIDVVTGDSDETQRNPNGESAAFSSSSSSLYRPFQATAYVHLTAAGDAEFAALAWQEQCYLQNKRQLLDRSRHQQDFMNHNGWKSSTSSLSSSKHPIAPPSLPPRKPRSLDLSNTQGQRVRLPILTASDASSQRAALEKLLDLVERFTELCGLWGVH